MIAQSTKHKVIGVVKDYNYASVRNVIEPFVISGQSKTAEMMYVRLQEGNFPETIEHLQHTWKQIYPRYTISILVHGR